MDLLDRTSDAARKAFFHSAFGEHKGYIAIAFLTPDKTNFFEEFFLYPAELPELLVTVRTRLASHNVYFCPNLFANKRRKKEEVITTPTAWADLDTCPPTKMLRHPTLTIESSAGRWQALWVLDEVETDDAERISKRIAYHHAPDGCDRSGWDLTQLLRVPLTYNFKYNATAGALQIVLLREHYSSSYRLKDFDLYPALAES